MVKSLAELGSKTKEKVDTGYEVDCHSRALRGRLLMSCRDELDDCPLYYNLPDLAQALVVFVPPDAFKAALVNAGYRVSELLQRPHAIKTNANSVVWDIMHLVQNKSPKKPPLAGSVAADLSYRPSIEQTFSIPKGYDKCKSEGGVARFPSPQAQLGTESQGFEATSAKPRTPARHLEEYILINCARSVTNGSISLYY
jgi:hypothetical protein